MLATALVRSSGDIAAIGIVRAVERIGTDKKLGSSWNVSAEQPRMG